MSKIIQIVTAPLNSERIQTRDGEDINRHSHILYALTDDGRVFWQRSDDSTEWQEQGLPEFGGQDG